MFADHLVVVQGYPRKHSQPIALQKATSSMEIHQETPLPFLSFKLDCSTAMEATSSSKCCSVDASEHVSEHLLHDGKIRHGDSLQAAHCLIHRWSVQIQLLASANANAWSMGMLLVVK